MTTPEDSAFAMLHSVLSATDFPCELDPLDAIGIHGVLVQLNKTLKPYETMPLKAVIVEPTTKRLKLEFNADDARTKALVEQWLGGVAQLMFSPSSWILEIILNGQGLSIRTVGLPDWRHAGQR